MLPKLYYKKQGEYCPLPEWACFYMNLGMRIAKIGCAQSRIVASLAVPTRAFSAAFIMTGGITPSILEESSPDEIQLEHILKQKPGTSVHVRRSNGKKVRGIIEEFKEIDNRLNIVVRIANKQQLLVPVNEYASRITVSETEITVPKKQQQGRTLEAPSDFLKQLFNTKRSQNHVLETSFEILFVGKVSLIKAEMCEVPFYFKRNAISRSGFTMGHLQEIARVRQFSGANQSYKSQCIPTSGTNPVDAIGTRQPLLVIFDGAISFLKHGHRWEKSHQIIILDRTDRQFWDAVELVNQHYAYRLDDISDLEIRIPAGIEMMLFTERS
jgi:hypothetical protein